MAERYSKAGLFISPTCSTTQNTLGQRLGVRQLSYRPRSTDAARGRFNRCTWVDAFQGTAFHRQADRAGHDICGPGGDRHRKRAAVRRNQDKSRQLAEASQHKSQFLANMSHELRTPLNAILGYTELVLDNVYGDTPDKMREVLDRIQRNGRHLLDLVNDLLDLSKIEAGRLDLSLADYSLRDVVQSVYSAVEALAKEKRIALKVELPPHLPAASGDERKLTQVLLNLVGNAIKFTDTGEVAIKAFTANGSFTVAVRDTGPGIAEAEQAKIFEEFQQADLSITKKKGGTGLGLAIAKRIIELHGGASGWVEPGAWIDVLFHRSDQG